MRYRIRQPIVIIIIIIIIIYYIIIIVNDLRYNDIVIIVSHFTATLLHQYSGDNIITY